MLRRLIQQRRKNSERQQKEVRLPLSRCLKLISLTKQQVAAKVSRANSEFSQSRVKGHIVDFQKTASRLNSEQSRLQASREPLCYTSRTAKLQIFSNKKNQLFERVEALIRDSCQANLDRLVASLVEQLFLFRLLQKQLAKSLLVCSKISITNERRLLLRNGTPINSLYFVLTGTLVTARDIVVARAGECLGAEVPLSNSFQRRSIWQDVFMESSTAVLKLHGHQFTRVMDQLAEVDLHKRMKVKKWLQTQESLLISNEQAK